jgi:hypothetical protein
VTPFAWNLSDLCSKRKSSHSWMSATPSKFSQLRWCPCSSECVCVFVADKHATPTKSEWRRYGTWRIYDTWKVFWSMTFCRLLVSRQHRNLACSGPHSLSSRWKVKSKISVSTIMRQTIFRLQWRLNHVVLACSSDARYTRIVVCFPSSLDG